MNMQMYFTLMLKKMLKKMDGKEDLCWDIPFICSWEDFNINKKNTYLFLIK